jgi:hypothetical protein
MFEKDLKKIMTEEMFNLYQTMSVTKVIDGCDDLSWCPTPGCKYAFEKDQNRFSCFLCYKEYCLDCRVEWHQDKTCLEWKTEQVNNRDETDLID